MAKQAHLMLITNICGNLKEKNWFVPNEDLKIWPSKDKSLLERGRETPGDKFLLCVPFM